jgi:hypothetical protein
MSTGTRRLYIRDTAPSGPPRQRPPRWALLAAYAVPLCVLPSAAWRCSLLFDETVSRHTEDWYVLTLSGGSVALALLTLGLVHPWGERVPRWVPVLGGRTIPRPVAVVPATTGALLLMALCLYALLNGVFHFVERGPVLVGPAEGDGPPPPEPGPGVAALYAPLLAWGPLLLAVTVNYWRRRTGRGGAERVGDPARPSEP